MCILTIKYLSTAHLYFLSTVHLYFLSNEQESSLTWQYVHKDLFSTILCEMAADAQCSPLKNLFFNVLKSHLYKSVPDTFQSNPKASDTKDRLE